MKLRIFGLATILIFVSSFILTGKSHIDKLQGIHYDYTSIPCFKADNPESGQNLQIDVHTANNFNDFHTSYTLLQDGIIAMEARDGTVWARQFGGYLMRSTNHGSNWDFVHEFEATIQGIHVNDYGDIFVSISKDRWSPVGTGKLYRSSDDGETFCKVLDIQSGAALGWNIASKQETMFVSEYGYKGDNGNNARRVYRSLDCGETWQAIYEPVPRLEYHKHKTLIANDGTVYQSIGDGRNASIKKSADNGCTWQTVVDRFHPTAAIDFDDHILWGLDSGPWHGIARLNKQTEQMEKAFELPLPFRGSCYDMVYAHGVVYAVFMSYQGHSHPGSIWFSKDEGATWDLFGSITKDHSDSSIGLYDIVTDGKYGFINLQAPAQCDYGNQLQYWGTLRFELLNAQET